MPPWPNFVGPSYVSQSPIADNRRTMNFYVEVAEVDGGKAKLAYYPTPGVEAVATSTSTEGRGACVAEGRHFVAIGSTLYEKVGGTLISRGTLAVDANPVTFAYNGQGGGQLLVSSGNNAYLLTLATNAFATVRTGATRMVGHLDGYFLALDTDTSTFFLSDLLDGTTWDPTQFAQRSAAPDGWESLKVLDRYVYLFGSETSEIWYNAGTFPFPFALHPSGSIPYGIGAAFSVTDVGGALCWLGRTKSDEGMVLKASGFTPEVISSFPVQVALAAYATRADAVGDSYGDLGHTFYLLSFPAAQATWAYDATPTLPIPPAMRWAERGTWISEEMRYEAWRPRFHVSINSQHLWLDPLSGTVYRSDSALGTDVDSRPIRRVIRPSGLWQDDERLFIPIIRLHLESGLGAVSGQGSDPQTAMRLSRNGGKTWGSERWRSAGELGEYGTRLRWERCGSGYHLLPEWVFTDPIPWRVTGASYEAA